MQIPDPNKEITIAAFTHGFVAEVFNIGIHKKYPRTLQELWLKVEKGIQVENLNRMKKRSKQLARELIPEEGRKPTEMRQVPLADSKAPVRIAEVCLIG